MEQLTSLAQRFMSQGIVSGDIVVDATAGNGWDTLFLAKIVGSSGKVYAFDIQAQALENTRGLLSLEGIEHVELIERPHEEMNLCIGKEEHGLIAGVMMNLGYLPGGNKELTTNSVSTLKAIRIMGNLLKAGGRATIVTYPGHESGSVEAEGVEQLMSNQSMLGFYEIKKNFPEGAKSPRLYMLEKRFL